MALDIQPLTVSPCASSVSIVNKIKVLLLQKFGQSSIIISIKILDKPIIFVQEEFHINKETGEVEALALVCSVQV